MPDQRASQSARELASLLQATETFLQVMAASHLPYDAVIRIEREAWRAAREHLAPLEGALDPVIGEYDEVPVLAPPAAAVEEPAVAEAPARSDFSSLVADEEPTVFLPLAALVDEAQATEERSSAEDGEPSWVSFDEAEPSEDEEIYIAVEPTPAASTPAPAPVAAAAPMPGASPSYVSFEDHGFEDHEDEEGDTQILMVDPDTGRPTPIDYSGVDAETLHTDDGIELEPLPDEIGALSDDALRPLGFDEEPAPARSRATTEVETFDLIPDLSDDDVQLEAVAEDDDVTSRHSVEELRRAARASAGPAVAGATASSDAVAATQRLYAGARAIPTIREGTSPRPRAAAVQVNAGAGTGQVVGLEEEVEPIEIGSPEDYGEEVEFDDGGGFRLEVQEYEDDLEPYYDEEDDEVVQPAARKPIPIPVRPTEDEIASIFARAKEAADSGDMQRGTDLYSDVIDADPEYLDAYVGRGRLYLDLGDYSRAMSDFMIAEEMAPENPEPQIAIGDLYFARKDYRKAIDYFNAALDADPNHAMAFCRRGISHYYRKNYPASLSDLQKAEQLDPEIPNIGTYITMARKKARK